MRGLDYRSIVGQGPEADSDVKVYVLQLGSVELEPISYATLLVLPEWGAVIAEVLDGCFVGKSVMWVDLATADVSGSDDQLREIEARLNAAARQIEEAGRPGCGVLVRVVGSWREATLGILGGLEPDGGSDPGLLTGPILADYRRSALAFVEALVQLLSEDDRCAIETRDRMKKSRARLANFLHVGPEYLGRAGWRKLETVQYEEDPGFVTWGVP